LTINKKTAQKTLSGSSSLNPEHSVKYKVLDANSFIETAVVDVLWELSKSGFFKPRIEIRPVVLFGTTVTYATGFNGKFINDNGIGCGAKVIITKSGMVIPYITQVTHSVDPKMPERKWIWNDNGVEAVLEDADNDSEVIFKQVLDFTNSLNIDLLKESNLAKVISTFKMGSQSYEAIIEILVNLLEGEWINAVGSNGSKIYASLQRRLNNLTVAHYLGSVKFMGFGFGVRKAKALVKSLNDHMDVWTLTVANIEQMDGFDTKTATAIAKGLPVAKAFAETLGLSFVQEVKTSEFANFNIVFTGFRDKELEEKLEKMGAKMGSSVSKKTTHLVTAEPNSTSTKAKKAREVGVKTLSIDEFKEEYNL
jgi:NAD-dependent DNA ligase